MVFYYSLFPFRLQLYCPTHTGCTNCGYNATVSEVSGGCIFGCELYTTSINSDTLQNSAPTGTG